MSGALLSGIGAAGALGSILFGANGPVILGGIVLHDQEVPETIRWGGAQKLNVHKMPGGKRVIDAMGRDDMPISWSGKMIGADADLRAWQFDQMRIAGAPVTLQWFSHLFTVVVSKFEATDAAFRVEYSITCEVLADQGAVPNGGAPSLLGAIMDDISTVMALVSLGTAIAGSAGSGIPDVGAQGDAITAGATAVQSLTQSVGPVTAGDDDATSIAAATTALQATATAAVTSGDAQLGYINFLAGGGGGQAGTGNPLGTADPGQAAANLVTVTEYGGLQAGALAVRGLVGRIATNLAAVDGATLAAAYLDATAPPAQAAGGNAGTTIQTAGGNLFAIAAQQLGDATQWYRIAQASGLDDPMLSGIVTLTIPVAIQAPSDGLPSILGVTIL